MKHMVKPTRRINAASYVVIGAAAYIALMAFAIVAFILCGGCHGGDGVIEQPAADHTRPGPWPLRYDEAGACDDCDAALDGMCDENGGDCTSIECGTTRTVDYRGKVTCGKDCDDDTIAFVECGVAEVER